MVGGCVITTTDSARSLIKRRLSERRAHRSSTQPVPLGTARRVMFGLFAPPLEFVDPLAFAGFLSAQFRLDKHVDVAIHHGLHIACLGAGAVVFHHLIRLKHVRTNLISPRDLPFFAVLPLYL